MRTLRTNGEHEARAYVEAAVPLSSVEPTMEMERVAVVDPREAPTLQLKARPKTTGPRNPEQTTLPPSQDEERVELPDGLPTTVAQRVIVPPELAAKWREEGRRKGGT